MSGMFFEKEEFEELLKCSFCKFRFTSIIKIIPECGSSICHVCFDDLRKELAETTEYECKSCNQKHIMSEQGLSDNKALAKMLTLKETVQVENEQIDLFVAQLKSLEARVNTMKNFDVEKELIAHCDSLWEQVTAAVENGLDHLKKLGDHLLTQISEYRDSVLANYEEVRPTKRFKSAVMEEIDAISQEIEQYGRQVIQQKLCSTSEDDLFAQSLRQVGNFHLKLDEYEINLKTEKFNGKLMRFRPAELNGDTSIQLGRMEFKYLKKEKRVAKSLYDVHSLKGLSESCYLSNDNNKPASFALTLIGHNDRVRQVVFLSDGKLASCSDDGTIKVWGYKRGKLMYELAGSKGRVTAMTLLSSNHLVTASADNGLYLWDLDQKMLCDMSSREHEDTIFALQTLSNGNIVSASFDRSMKVWDVRESKLVYLGTILGHGIKFESNIGILANNHVVTCSNDKDTYDDGIIRVWCMSSKRLLNSIHTKTSGCCALQVLKNRRVAFGFRSGKIDIYTLRQDNDCLRINAYQTEGSFCLAESPEGDLLSGGPCTDPTIKLWNPNTGQLIRTILSGHLDGICSMSISSDGKVLATASPDMTVKVIFL